MTARVTKLDRVLQALDKHLDTAAMTSAFDNCRTRPINDDRYAAVAIVQDEGA